MASRRAASPSSHPVRARTAATSRILERLRAVCLALPEANERPSHGEPTWFAGKGKVFAMFDDHHHGADHVAVWLPLPRGAQEMLIESDPARYFRPPYVGPAGWVGVVLDVEPDWATVTTLVRDAFLHVATAKLRAIVAPDGDASATPPAPGLPRARSGSRGAVRWVALLRGINVGKHRRVAMTDVRAAFEAVGATDVSTYIQSGNVVFAHRRTAESTLVRRLEDALREVVGSEVPVVLRDAAEMAEVVAKIPFRDVEPEAVHVSFLAEPPPPRWLAPLDRASFLPEEARVVGRQLYLHLPGGIGRSKLAVAVTRLGGPTATVRNWRTAETLARLVADT